MPFEAVKDINETEQHVRMIKAEAAAAEKKAVAEAEAAGKKTVEAARLRASSEREALLRAAELEATQYAQSLAGTTENRKASLEVSAQSHLEAAAALIIERIVNG